MQIYSSKVGEVGGILIFANYSLQRSGLHIHLTHERSRVQVLEETKMPGRVVSVKICQIKYVGPSAVGSPRE